MLTPGKARTNAKHLEKLDQIMLRPYSAEGKLIRRAAADAGQSVQAYILDAVRERMKSEGKQPEN